jgi:hypothetical protein
LDSYLFDPFYPKQNYFNERGGSAVSCNGYESGMLFGIAAKVNGGSFEGDARYRLPKNIPGTWLADCKHPAYSREDGFNPKGELKWHYYDTQRSPQVWRQWFLWASHFPKTTGPRAT